MEQARRFVVAGMVQGVGYRFFVERAARQLGLSGYVKNLPDGRVEVYAIGAPEQLDDMKRRLGQGPRAARVRSVEEQPGALDADYRGDFSIEGGGW